MPPLKQYLKYGGLFLICYIVLMGVFSIPAIDQIYGSLFAKVNKMQVGWIIPNSFVEIEAPSTPPDGGKKSVRVILGNKKQIAEKKAQNKSLKSGSSKLDMRMRQFRMNYRQTSMIPMIFLWSLILVTPIARSKKLKGLLIGTIIFSFIVALRMLVRMIMNCHNNPWLDLVELKSFGLKLIEGLHLSFNMGANMVMVIFIWLIVVGSKEGLRKVFGS